MVRIMTNIAAIIGQRNLNKTGARLAKSLEQLSSGSRINRAADDAAGLAISEKLRAQIRGNQQALRNAQDGISMVQTAEGAMDEMHAILQRMRELGVQAANGSYADNGPERTAMGDEILQLTNELDRIANATQFNGQKLMSSSLTGIAAGVGGTDLVAGDIIGLAAGGVAATDLVAGDTLSGTTTVSSITLPPALPPGNYTFVNNSGTLELHNGASVVATAAAFGSGASVGPASASTVTFSSGLILGIANPGASAYTFGTFLTDITAAANDSLVTTGATATGLSATSALAQTYTITSAGAGSLTLTGADGSTQTLSGITDLLAGETRSFNFSQLGVSFSLSAGAAGAPVANLIASLAAASNDTIVVTGSGNSSQLQIGSNVPDSLVFSFTDLQSSQLGNGTYMLGGPTGLVTTLGTQAVKTVTDATNLIAAVDGAIQTVSAVRGDMGSIQNRLEHTISTLGVTVESLTSSDSRIRDADIAQLSTEMVSAQILQQAGVSVLAQANQTSQAVLQLLKQ